MKERYKYMSKQLSKTNLNQVRINLNKIIKNTDVTVKVENSLISPITLVSFKEDFPTVQISPKEDFSMYPLERFISIKERLENLFSDQTIKGTYQVNTLLEDLKETKETLSINIKDSGKIVIDTAPTENKIGEVAINKNLLLPLLKIFKAYGEKVITFTKVTDSDFLLKIDGSYISAYQAGVKINYQQWH